MKLLQTLFGASTSNDPATRALALATPVDKAGPWIKMASLPIDGLTAVGFDRSSDTLLVCSSAGQSVISGATGEILYRNADNDGLDISALKGTRLDHPAEERIDMAGRYGGGLRNMTEDGWSVELAHGVCILNPPKASRQPPMSQGNGHARDSDGPYLLHRPQEALRALGFSWTSQTLAVATDGLLMLWHRPAPLRL